MSDVPAEKFVTSDGDPFSSENFTGDACLLARAIFVEGRLGFVPRVYSFAKGKVMSIGRALPTVFIDGRNLES